MISVNSDKLRSRRPSGIGTGINIGARIPAVFLNEDNDGPYAHICMSIGDEGNKCKNVDISLKRWHRLTLVHREKDDGNFVFDIALDGDKTSEDVNNQPRIFDDTKLFVSGIMDNAFSQKRDGAFDGLLKNFKVCPTSKNFCSKCFNYLPK